ncbi:hypothetical protein CIL05_07025 [Virgibacillus profundi]|uniref:Uncharacterized protein n=1 Tax=Virgibacillus profundi TaxID=2024555 RepID=A0A2A2IF78_9BACI|nr:hypothetical protein [Virgibacillus profundi]PAV30212.1 hypothetical protein CIL05_07025 [Virgibacillus profundi]PXY54384.1 hypothetical protein CIT14_07110 [Virgibacillus profundi]
MQNKSEFITLVKAILSDMRANNDLINTNNRERLLSYLGQFDASTNKLILDFYKINKTIAKNGGIPVLKEIINKFETKTF